MSEDRDRRRVASLSSNQRGIKIRLLEKELALLKEAEENEMAADLQQARDRKQREKRITLIEAIKNGGGGD